MAACLACAATAVAQTFPRGEIEFRRITDAPSARGDTDPAWSPDGARIAFTRTTGDGRPSAIWVMDADGGNSRQLTTPGGNGSDRGPTWSPDGRRIAFTRSDPSAPYGDVFTVNDDGGDLRRLTETPFPQPEDAGAGAHGPAWSPDGSQIAVAWARDGSDGIHLLPASGGPSTRVTNQRGDERSPAWSPDGGRIAYVHDESVGFNQGPDGGEPADIRIVNRDGTGDTVFVDESRRPGVFAGTADPAWSPDGSWIAYAVVQGIVVRRLDGAAERNLTSNPGDAARPADDAYPAWAPNGRGLAFAAYRDESRRFGIHVVGEPDAFAGVLVNELFDLVAPRVLRARILRPRRAPAAAAALRRIRIRARDDRTGLAGVQLASRRVTARRFQPFRSTLRTRRRGRLYVRVLDRAGNVSRWRRVAG